MGSSGCCTEPRFDLRRLVSGRSCTGVGESSSITRSSSRGYGSGTAEFSVSGVQPLLTAGRPMAPNVLGESLPLDFPLSLVLDLRDGFSLPNTRSAFDEYFMSVSV